MREIRTYIRESRETEVLSQTNELIAVLEDEGLYVDFGKIGTKTTYAMIYNEDHSVEYVGFTFIQNLKYYNENTGKLKALHQALARKETLSMKN